MFLSFAFFVIAQENKTTTNNVFLDSDQDGLTDAEEKTYGTDPFNPDTNGDGYSDGAEVKSGYDPLTGKKIMISPNQNNSTGAVLGQSDIKNSSGDSSNNLTQQMAQKISELTTKNGSQDQSVSLQDIQSLVSDALNSSVTSDELPQINKADIKIKKQDYTGTADEIKAKKKDDFINYITAVFYIISSNSPRPLTSSSDMSSTIISLTNQILDATSKRDSSALADLNKSGEKITEQLKSIEVPEELVDIHTKALSYAMYSQTLEKNIDPTPGDPIKDIANFSKIRAFIASLSSFTDDVQSKFSDYGITYDDTIKNKLKSLGIDSLNFDDATLNQILNDVKSSTASVTGDAATATDTTTTTDATASDVLNNVSQ